MPLAFIIGAAIQSVAPPINAMNKLRFIEPMEALPAKQLPQGPGWNYEIKVDGYRGQVVRETGRLLVYSRRGNQMSRDFPEVVESLEFLPAGTIIDGELAALDADGRPSFQLMQNRQIGRPHIVYFAFDILVHGGVDVMKRPLSERRSLLRSTVIPNDHVSISEFSTSSQQILQFVKEQKLEGIIAKKADSLYEPGKRSGAWVKTRIHLAQEFVIGGYTPSHLGIDAMVIGFYRGKDLLYAGRVRAGFTPRSRRTVYEKIKHLEIKACPFTNLPQASAGRWNLGLTAEKMKECHWLRPVSVAQIEFVEWTTNEQLRGASFVGLRTDKNAREVVKEP